MKKRLFWPIVIGTGLGTGFSPIAPGTAGALLATIIWVILYQSVSYTILFLLTLFLIVLFTAAGVWSANRLEPCWGKDPSRVVVDEMVGVWIPLLAVPDRATWYWYVIGAFILFRLFDIFKPMGIRRMEDLKGGVGVMMDDILAGVYSLIILVGIRWVVG